MRLHKGSRTQPCRGCGVGVTNKQQLCCQCGYRSELRRATRASQNRNFHLEEGDIMYIPIYIFHLEEGDTKYIPI